MDRVEFPDVYTVYTTYNQRPVCLKIEIHKVNEMHSDTTSAKYRNPRNPQTARNPHWQSTNQQAILSSVSTRVLDFGRVCSN